LHPDLERLKAALADRYPITREIGSGGMATVYLARDAKHGRDVAVKVMHPELSSALGTERFLREIAVTSRLSHPHILPLLDSGEAGGFLFYVMPYIEGETLRQRLDRERQLPIGDAVRLAQQVAQALGHAHGLGIVHRDVKPENILLTGEEAVVADFGIARALTEAGGERLTQTGLAIGTPRYMSPELATGHGDVDGRSDVYALGCVLYEMLTGAPPFTGPNPQAILARHAIDPVPSLRTVRLTVSEGLEQAVMMALAKLPADRFRNAEEFGHALAQQGTPQYGVPVYGTPGGIDRRVSPAPRQGLMVWLRAHRAASAMVALAVLVGAALAVRKVRETGEVAWVDGRPESVVVVPFRIRGTTEAEGALAAALAENVTRELNQWESIRAVPGVSLTGPIADLGLEGPALERLSDGFSVANAAGAQALATVSVRIAGDSAHLTASLFDVRTRRQVGRSIQSAGLAGEVGALAAPVVYGVIAVEGAGMPPEVARRLTGNPAALALMIDGRQELATRRLPEAEQSFRRAIALDSGFAGAISGLAQTLYWKSETDWAELKTVGPEIARLSAVAVRNSAGLPARDSLHIGGFDAFQLGDYVTARGRYQALLAADTADVFAWLMLGSVEVVDPWLEEGAPGEYRPRGNLNVAQRAFATAVRLQPTFDLGYGQLFEIYKTVAQPVDGGGCDAFELPGGDPIPPWGMLTPARARPFCAVVLDSIRWVTRQAYSGLDPKAVEAGASRIFDQAVLAARRWADFAPDLARPREELVATVLRRRSMLGAAPPQVAESLAKLALVNATEALALRSDTLPLDLLQLGGLHLGVGDLGPARTLTEQGLALYRSRSELVPDQVALNVFLATGQAEDALQLIATLTKRSFIPDSVADSMLPFGGAEPVLERIRALGAMGVGGAPLLRELRALGGIWAAPRYAPRQALLLRRFVAPSLSSALALDDSVLAAWDAELHPANPLWRALAASARDSAEGAVLLRRALAGGLPAEPGSFVLGMVAARVGDHATAVALFTRLDSLPLTLDRRELGWGDLVESYRLRAESYAALGDSASAAQWYGRFVGAWSAADSLTSPQVEEAAGALRRLHME